MDIKTNVGRPWIERGLRLAIDFDGVIHRYSQGWQGGKLYDPPVDGAQDALAKLEDRGYEIIIFTTRADSEEDVDAIRAWLRTWGFHNADTIEITNIKPPAIAYIDDRAVRFTNWEDIRKLWA